MDSNSTIEMILKTLLRLAKDVDLIKKAIFNNGLSQKIEILWAAHPILAKKIKVKNKRHAEIPE